MYGIVQQYGFVALHLAGRNELTQPVIEWPRTKLSRKNGMLNGRVARRNGKEKRPRVRVVVNSIFCSDQVGQVMIRLHVCCACSLAFHLINHSHFDGADALTHARTRRQFA